MSKVLVKNSNESGQVAGKLYFVSTLGSALGTIITSFYLVLWFDINTIVISVSLLLSLLGITTIAFAKANASFDKTNPERDISHA